MERWNVTQDYDRGQLLYRVYRLRNDAEPDMEQNRDYIGSFDQEERAQEFADAMNEVMSDQDRGDPEDGRL